MSDRGRTLLRRLVRTVSVATVAVAVGSGLAVVPQTAAEAATCVPKVGSLACSTPGTKPKPPPPPPSASWRVTYRVWSNHIKIYKGGKLVRDVPVAGNPYLSPHLPSTCYVNQKIRTNWDKTNEWRLDYFTRLCAGRGVGTHAIPVNRFSGRLSMNPADLGKTPGIGSPVSHGCARMRERDARWIYENVPIGTKVSISYAR